MVWRVISFLPVVGMVALSALAGWAMLGWAGVGTVVLAVSVIWFTDVEDRVIAARSQMHDTPRRKRISDGFRDRLRDLADRAGLKREPQLNFADGPPNAFTLLLKSSGGLIVVVSESLHDLLSERQLLAVSAHELAHVAAGEHKRLLMGEILGRIALLSAVAALIAGALAFVVSGHQLAPNWVWWILAVGPTALSGLNLAVSRRGEFRADAEAARLTGDPLALSQALAKIQFASNGGSDLRATVEEFAGLRGRGWWRTHPPVEARIDRLQRLAGRGGV